MSTTSIVESIMVTPSSEIQTKKNAKIHRKNGWANERASATRSLAGGRAREGLPRKIFADLLQR